MRNENVLIIFAKSPRGGDVKTRLASHITEEERVRLYTSLLEGTIDKLGDVPETDTVISYTPPEEGAYFRKFGLRMSPQSGGDIGKRMHNALQRVLDEGYLKAVLVGVDIPGLSGPIVRRAFELLSESDVVFGPASDGGYYLVGLKAPKEEIFTGIEWSTESTLTRSVEKAMASGLKVARVDTLSDIDRPEDLKKYLPE